MKWYLLGYDAVLLEVLGSKLIIAGQAGYFDIWVLGFDQLGAEAKEYPRHTLAPFLRGHAKTFHQHGLTVVNHVHRFQCDLSHSTITNILSLLRLATTTQILYVHHGLNTAQSYGILQNH